MSAPSSPAVETKEATQLAGEDITEFLRETARGMALGEMIFGGNFSLKEAMSAVELMDAKMDAGMQSELNITLEEALARNLVPRDLTPWQQLAVMDELMAAELTWYNGKSFPHTVLTCWYAHKPTLLKSLPVLHAVVNATLKTCAGEL